MSADPFDMMAADAAEAEAAQAEKPVVRDVIARHVRTYAETMRKKLELDIQTEALSEALRKLVEFTIPEALRAANLSGIKLPDGTKVNLESTVQTSLSAEKKPAAYSWLREHGHEDVIKSKLSIAFAKGDTERVEATRAALEELQVPFELQDDVHASTYKALIRELMGNGEQLPLDVLGVFIVEQAKVTFPKSKSPR